MKKSFSNAIYFLNCVTVFFFFFVFFFYYFCKFRFDVAHCIATSQRNITSVRNRHCDDSHSQYNHFLNIFIRKMSEETW